MIRFKKLAAGMLAAMMLLLVACNKTDSSSAGSGTEPGGTSSSMGEADPTLVRPDAASGQIVIGTTTSLNENMMWGFDNNSPNAGFKALMFDTGATMNWGEDAAYHPNYNVLNGDPEFVDNEDGSRTYTVKIQPGLVYNNGDPITAKDFVFSIMLNSSKPMQDIGGSVYGGIDFVGYEEFLAGTTNTFTGLALIDELTFSITVKAEELPYHYEFNFYNVFPLPMHIIAPDADIVDEGEGATITGEFSEEVLRETINDPDSGYRYFPTVTPGSYQFVSFDPNTNEGILAVNPNYPGDYRDQSPLIERIIMREVTKSTMFDSLRQGEVDLLASVNGGQDIETGLDMAEEGVVDFVDFPRNGYGYIRFSCDFGPTQFPEVRRAISWLIDRDEFARTFTGGYGTVVDSNYGLAQREYMMMKDELESRLTHYTKDPDKAVAELEAIGFVLDAQGNDYDPSKGGAKDGNIRHRQMEDGTLMPLTIEWCSPGPDNDVSDLLALALPDAASDIGMLVNQNSMAFNLLQESIARKNGAVHHMFNMASGFPNTPAYWYYVEPGAHYSYNGERIDDEELYAIALEMKSVPMDDEETWNRLWVDHVVRYNELAVTLPLYSDIYHSFYDPKLVNYNQIATYDWWYSLADAWVV